MSRQVERVKGGVGCQATALFASSYILYLTGVASFWSPSRGPTSTRVTLAGSGRPRSSGSCAGGERGRGELGESVSAGANCVFSCRVLRVRVPPRTGAFLDTRFCMGSVRQPVWSVVACRVALGRKPARGFTFFSQRTVTVLFQATPAPPQARPADAAAAAARADAARWSMDVWCGGGGGGERAGERRQGPGWVRGRPPRRKERSGSKGF